MKFSSLLTGGCTLAVAALFSMCYMLTSNGASKWPDGLEAAAAGGVIGFAIGVAASCFHAADKEKP